MDEQQASTTVEIILYYLTVFFTGWNRTRSTTVEIILYYLTDTPLIVTDKSTTVEIILYYLTIKGYAVKEDLQQ